MLAIKPLTLANHKRTLRRIKIGEKTRTNNLFSEGLCHLMYESLAFHSLMKLLDDADADKAGYRENMARSLDELEAMLRGVQHLIKDTREEKNPFYFMNATQPALPTDAAEGPNGGAQ